jgi:gamma-glutamyltranspeptidase
VCEPAGVSYGRAQAVGHRLDGVLLGASDPRADGFAQGF